MRGEISYDINMQESGLEGSLTMAKVDIERWIATACAAMLLIGGAVLLGMVWEWFWNLF